MAKIKNLIKGLTILSKYIDDNESDEYDVTSFEDETLLCVSCETNSIDTELLTELGWDYNETDYDQPLWFYCK
jgi:hypothetical protein